ncbi:MAG: MurR/RpiR family transcriptional regulator [Anaerolineales bacterium]
MEYENRIRAERAGMSKSFAKLADFLLDSYIEAAFMTASELAHALNLDAATVVRFSQHLGYNGFPELQQEIREKVRRDFLIRPKEALIPDSHTHVAYQALNEIATAIEQTRNSLDTDALNQLVEMIGKARRILILAEGPAQPNAYSLVQYLEQGGFPVYVARSGVVDLARTINTATNQDLIIAIEIKGQSVYIAGALCEAQSKGIPTAAILGTASLASARCANIVISAATNPSLGVSTVAVEAMIYALSQLLHWRFADRFAGTEQAIAEISNRLQSHIEK